MTNIHSGSGGAALLTATPRLDAEAWLRTPAAGQQRGGLMMALVIWVPSVLVALGCLYIGEMLPAVLALAVSLLTHTLLRPIVAVYVLVASVPLEWTVVVIPDVTQLSKLLGIFALLVSIPKLFSLAVPTRWDRSGRWMALMIAWACCGIAWAEFPSISMIGASSFALRWGLAVLICVYFTDERSVRNLKLFFLAACIASSVIYLMHSNMRDVLESQKRAEMVEGAGGNVNDQARMLGVALFIALLGLLERKNLLIRLSYLGAVFLLVVVIIVLKGRAVYLGIPVAVVGASILLGGAGLSRRLGFLLLAGMVGAVLGFAVVKFGFFGEGITARFNSIFSEGTGAGGRSYYWQKHFEAFLETGFLGTGIDQMVWRPGSGFRVAHNDWFSIAGELGLAGLVCFAMFHATLFLRMRRIPNLHNKLFCLLCWVFMCFVGLSADDFVLKWYAVATGLIIATLHLHERARPDLLPVAGPTAGGGQLGGKSRQAGAFRAR